MSELIEQLKKHEGFRSKPYLDINGYTTIGYGFNIDAGVTKYLAEVILRYQVCNAEKQISDKYKWFSALSRERKDVIVNMVFNLGIVGFGQFKKMIRAIEFGDDVAVFNEMLDSRWAKQVKQRAYELANQWRNNAPTYKG